MQLNECKRAFHPMQFRDIFTKLHHGFKLFERGIRLLIHVCLWMCHRFAMFHIPSPLNVVLCNRTICCSICVAVTRVNQFRFSIETHLHFEDFSKKHVRNQCEEIYNQNANMKIKMQQDENWERCCMHLFLLKLGLQIIFVTQIFYYDVSPDSVSSSLSCS